MGFGFITFTLVVFLLAFTGVLMGFRKVPQGWQYTVERFGKYRRTLTPGPNIINPFLDNVAHKMDMREQVMDLEPQEVITADNAKITVDGVAFFQIMDASKAAYQISDFRAAVTNVIMTNIRAAIGSMSMDDVLSKRRELATEMLHDADNTTQPWGIKISNVRIKDLSPPADLVEAMTKQLKAEREKRAAVLEAEGKKQAEIARAEGSRHAAILHAEGEKEASVLHAQAEYELERLQAEARQNAAEKDAEARRMLAQAEAQATQMLSRAISNGSAQAINYFVAEKYMDALKALASADNQKVILMPLEASSIIGALGGVSELARQAFPHLHGGPAPKDPPPAGGEPPPPGDRH